LDTLRETSDGFLPRSFPVDTIKFTFQDLPCSLSIAYVQVVLSV